MQQLYALLIVWTSAFSFVHAQSTPTVSPCSHDAIMARHLTENSKAELEQSAREAFIRDFITKMNSDNLRKDLLDATYTIPVVLHVFHNGDDGKIDMEQVQSGMDIINDDFNGLNEGWDSIDPAFDSIKGTLDIQFCLASIDPEGNPTTGVNYYDNEEAMYNNVDLFEYAWDNYQYMNIYLPKYAFNEPSNFTAYAYYPSTNGSDNNRGGVVYSSIRWGYGSLSELEAGQDWASVGTHEVGHWLDLRHTFEGGCGPFGDLVDDTPPTLGSGIELTGCNNNDFSCGVATNGENFMDYNHDCKKMFTQGQVDRMIAALHLPSRLPLWSEANLVATGCASEVTSTRPVSKERIQVYPNPATNWINFDFETTPERLFIFDVNGRTIFDGEIDQRHFQLNTFLLDKGMCFYRATFANRTVSGKFILQ